MRKLLIILLGLALSACDDGKGGGLDPNNMMPGGGGGGDTSGIPTGSPLVSVSGKVFDFETGAAMAGSASLTINGISPPPTVSVTGTEFLIERVPGFSVFHMLAGSPPDYRNTYNAATAVESSDRVGLEALVLKETYLTGLTTAFGINPVAGRGILIARITDASGVSKAGVPAAALQLRDAKGPYFLDAQKKPAPALAATSASGFVVFFDAPIGGATVSAGTAPGWVVQAGLAPTAAQVVTLTDVIAEQGMLPVVAANVSFTTKVIPIFTARGCVNCHSGGGPGKDLGGLHLDGGSDHIYKEITDELSPIQQKLRIDLKAPEKSLIVTMPSFENPADRHPTATFPSPADPDYQILLTWIKEGAKLN